MKLSVSEQLTQDDPYFPTQLSFRRSMDIQNSTKKIYFILLGLSQYPRVQTMFFCLLLMSYVVTLLGNSLILLLRSSALHAHVLLPQ